MLRRAMNLGGFHQVIFICHSTLVWELADRTYHLVMDVLLQGIRKEKLSRTIDQPPCH
jgi:hypothetical protein